MADSDAPVEQATAAPGEKRNLSLGVKIRAARERAGQPIEHAAIVAGRTAQTVLRWERGTTAPPRGALLALAREYDAPDLLDDR